MCGTFLLSLISIYIASSPNLYAWVIASWQNLDDELANVNSPVKLCTTSPAMLKSAKLTQEYNDIIANGDNEEIIGVCHLLRKLAETIRSQLCATTHLEKMRAVDGYEHSQTNQD